MSWHFTLGCWIVDFGIKPLTHESSHSLWVVFVAPFSKVDLYPFWKIIGMVQLHDLPKCAAWSYNQQTYSKYLKGRILQLGPHEPEQDSFMHGSGQEWFIHFKDWVWLSCSLMSWVSETNSGANSTWKLWSRIQDQSMTMLPGHNSSKSNKTSRHVIWKYVVT